MFEDQALNSVIATVAAADLRQTSSPILYTISSGNENSMFSIDPASGAISLTAPLDFETRQAHSLSVMAFGFSSQSAMAMVLIFVTDVNDNSPVFTQSTYTSSIVENAPPDDSLLQVSASDADASLANNLISFSIFPLVPEFSVNAATGVISSLVAFDYEAVQAYNFTVIATDAGEPSLSSTASIIINIVDQNDVRPQFTQAIVSVQISEMAALGSPVAQIMATDSDTTNITYSLLGGNDDRRFSINPSSGLITLTGMLDFETTNFYNLSVTASDGVIPSSTATVTIQITDANDNAPVFSQEIYMETILEDVIPGSFILQVFANDSDSGVNGKVAYFLGNSSQDSRSFTISQTNGLISLSLPLDYESQPQYEFTVFAIDDGEPAQTSQALIRIAIRDVNDNPPVFVNNNISVVVNEDIQNGSQVAVFMAMDADSGSNAAVSYQLQESGSVPFAVNPISGVVLVEGILDYEDLNSYQVSVVAFDNGQMKLSSTATLAVLVADVNDNPPIFTQQQYSESLQESLSVGSVVLTVRAFDEDSGTNAVVSYSIVAGNINQAFQIDNTTGEITLANSLDFELVSSYSLSVRATNNLASNLLASTAAAIVSVNEVNEFVPTFSRNEYTFQIQENIPAGVAVGTVEASDMDGGLSGELVFEIVPMTAEPSFAILDNGTITTLVRLDREQQDRYQFNVVARDLGIPPFNASVRVTVNILDKNDIPPTFFFSSYSASVEENVVAGTDIILTPPLMVSDGDDPNTPNSLITFSIASGNEDGLFVIDAQTGLLQTAGAVDFETASSYVLEIQAQDSGDPALSSSATISISITDLNDNAPLISDAPSLVTFLEGQDPLQVAPNVTVRDPDSLPISLITATLTSSSSDQARAGMLSIMNSPSNVLSILNNGRTLRLSGSFDDEEATLAIRSLEYTNTDNEPESSNRAVSIVLADGQFQTTSQTVVIIQLVNDNNPVLDLDSNSPGLNYTATFVEDGQPVSIAGNVVISDLDMSRIVSVEARVTEAPDAQSEGLFIRPSPSVYNVDYRDQNLTVSVTFLMPSTFNTVQDAVSGLSYYNSADEPSPLSRSVVVTVSDGDLVSAPATSNINIQLVNDPPTILLGPMTNNFVTFSEGQGPVFLSERLIIADSDSEVLSNATVSLLQAPDGSDESLLVSVSAVPSLTVSATPHSITIPGPATPEQFVTILQTVQYNNVLQRPSPTMRTVVYTIGDTFLQAQATAFVTFNLFNDPPIVDLNGAAPGMNYVTQFEEGSVPVSIASSELTVNDVDDIQLSSAVISFATRPDGDLEHLSLGSFPSELTVNEGPAVIEVSGLASTATYSAFLAGINYFNMAEEPTAGDRIISIVVSDGESNSSIVISTVQVLQVNDPPVLQLNNNTLFTVLYVEEQPPVSLVDSRYGIVVEDNDNVTFSHLSAILSNILDGDSEILGYKDSSSDQSLSVTTVLDSQANSRSFQFRFSSASSASVNFAALVSSLTYRSTSREPTAGRRVITFTLSDGLEVSQLQSTNVDVVLVNDNVPRFQQFLYTARVKENLAGVPVTTIMASDEDSSEGQFAGQGRLRYEIISGNDVGLFQINEETGVISIVRALDREEGTFSPALTVRASNLDSLEPSLGVAFPTVFVIITVEDVNDNTPQFQGVPYLFQVAEHALMGASIGNITATDADAGRNSQIEYILTHGVLNNALVIDANSGEIRVGNSASLDREAMATVTFSVTAHDGGTPQTSNTTLVTLSLTDVNDNPPLFSDSVYIQSVSESIPSGSRVLTVSATDADAGLNKQFSFSLSGSSTFAINSSSGEIYTSTSLDRESLSFYSFQVLATDFGSPELSSSASVEITLADENDNPPIFEERQYTVTILENSPLQQPVDVVLATDLDSGLNAEISYSIVENVPFAINSQNGIITVSGSLDREVQDTYSFTVVATDNGTPAQSAQILYNITLEDVNDNRPSFDQQSYSISAAENLPSLSVLTRVSASDRDMGSNAQLEFSLMDPSQTFQIDSMTGEISVASILDFETQSTYLIDITVSDRGMPSLSATTTLIVNLTDENDNAPTFDQQMYQFRIMENLPPQVVGTVVASDRDSGPNANLSYALINTSTSGNSVPFRVDSNTGEIFSSSTLDRESISNYSLLVSATDMGSPSLSSTAEVTILVDDTNDNAPVFIEVYTLSVEENIPVNSTLLSIQAQDADEGSNAAIMFQIVGGNTLGLFDIDRNSGVLTLAGTLDAEASQTHRLQVQATDNGTPSQSSVTAIVISVNNINDEPLMIDISTSSISYMEQAAPVAIFGGIVVSDRDVTSTVVNATVELITTESCCDELVIDNIDIPGVEVQLRNRNTSILILGPATTDQISQILQAILYVDSNPEPQVHIVIIRVSASDGLHLGVAEVTVTVTTINDNAPVVNLDNANQNFTSLFVENQRSVNIVDQVEITDQDSGVTLLQSVTVTLTTAPDGVLEAISVNASGRVTVFPTVGHVLRLSGPAPIQDFINSLSTLQYVNMADDPRDPLLRSVQVVADDGRFQSSPSYAFIDIVPVNDPPRLWLSLNGGFNTTFVENGGPVRLTAEGSQLVDPDSPMLASVLVTITNPVDRGSEYIIVSSSNPLVMTRISDAAIVLSGPAPLAMFLQSIQSVFYLNNASNPSIGYRQVLFNISDGELDFTVAALVQIETVNDAPVVDLNGLMQPGNDFSGTFTEGGSPIPLASNTAVIEDSDNTTVASLVVTIQQALDGNHELLSLPNVPESITVTYSSGSLELRGVGSLTVYSELLRNITYVNTADEPSGMGRLIQVVAGDNLANSEPSFTMIEFSFVNDAPVITLGNAVNFITTYLENSPAIPVSNLRSATITDVDSAALSYLVIVAVNLLDGQSEVVNYTDPVGGLLEDIIDQQTERVYNLSYARPMPLDIFNEILLSIEYQNIAAEPNATLPRMFILTVNDGELSSTPATSTVSIQLVDDNEPQFNSPVFRFSVSEGVQVGAEVGPVSATDLDLGDTFLYRIGSPNVPFIINQTNGVIYTSAAIDRETNERFDIIVLTTRPFHPFSEFNSRATVVIDVLDINDNPPSFNQTSLSLQVREDVQVGLIIATVIAADPDDGTNAALMYSVDTDSVDTDSDDPFEVDRLTGNLSTTRNLDREQDNVYHLSIVASDNGNPLLSSSVSVTITVTDINDNAPQFLQSSYSVELMENTPVGMSVTKILAEDEDAGSNGQIIYSLNPTNPQFSLDSNSGIITTLTPLIPGQYNFIVTAEDGGLPSLNSSIPVVIEIISFNSTLPAFTQSSYDGSVRENTPPGRSIVQVSATDPTGEETLIYNITSTLNSTFFDIDSASGLIQTGASNLDREARDFYQLQVSASSPDGIRTAITQVNVRVLDENEFAPIFDSNTYSFSIAENNNVGASIGNISATDPHDIEENSQVTAYTTSSSLFSISLSGVLSSNVKFDRENRSTYSFTVFASDGGFPSLTGSTAVFVEILDVNDQVPMFNQSRYEGQLTENSPIGTFVLEVTAFDDDLNNNGEIIFSTSSSLFSVNAITGVVTNSVEFDFEGNPNATYNVTVTATDNGTPVSLSENSTVSIFITDVDDTPPTFSMQTYFTSIPEEELATSFFQLLVTDTDSNLESNPVTFAISGGDPDGYFSIDSSGSLSVIQPLDRELLSQYGLTIEASNQNYQGTTLTSSASVVVEVLDINDNSPVFRNPSYSFTILEQSPPGTNVGFLMATDRDLPINANITGFIISSGDSRNQFQIGSSSGVLEISANGDLTDREVQSQYTLVVSVSDNGTPPRFSSTNVTVIVLDVNDNSPTFDQSSYNISVSENISTGAVVFSAASEANDLDEGSNAVLSFSLASSSQNNNFAITSDGLVTVANNLDFESQRLYLLTIQAVDGGSPPLTGTAQLNINILDQDDLPLEFSSPSFNTSALENATIGSTILNISAIDPDTVQGNPITYFIQEPSLPFAINPSNGAISVVTPLDREETPSYSFSVFASNTPGFTATATVNIEVLDVNDNDPQFPNGPFQFPVSESEPVGFRVGQVSANDSDTGASGRISSYSLVGHPSSISIDPSNGTLFLTGRLDYEVNVSYTFEVLASDAGDPRRIGQSSITINILDANDNSPRFSADQYLETVLENVTVGSTVFTASAQDADSSSNGNIVYSLGQSSAGFTINSISGVITTSLTLTVQNYTISIIAQDMGTPSLNSISTLIVQVLDVNQNPVFLNEVYSTIIPEDRAVNSLVVQVFASDPDSGTNAEIQYGINTTQDQFAIDSQSGRVTVRRPLDFEEQQEYLVSIFAIDSGNPPLSTTATLIVNVTDVNDNPPVFSRSPYRVLVPENVNIGSSIETVEAMDRDSTSNGFLTYSILQDFSSGSVTIDPLTGTLTTIGSLDYETDREINIVVEARDGGIPFMTAAVSVVISLTDIDDNPPVFSQRIYTVPVIEDILVGQPVARVNATDADNGTNADIQYSLTNLGNLPFSIDSQSGIIFIGSPGLDRELESQYTINVLAINPSSPLFNDSASVIVIVLDSNDNRPQFDQNTLTLFVSESVLVGSIIGSVNATDADTSTNAVISYSFDPPSNLVSIDGTSGDIQLGSMLDFETMPIIDLTVVATDSGTSPLTNAANLRINVENVNDEAPVLSIISSQFIYQEGSPSVTIGTGLTLSDLDMLPIVSGIIQLFYGAPNVAPPPTDFIQTSLPQGALGQLQVSATASSINITGLASVSIYESLLASLQFGSTAGEPSVLPRFAILQVNDGTFASNSITLTVNIALINDNDPILDLSTTTSGLGYSVTFTEGGSPVILVGPDVRLSDADDDLFQSINITLINPVDPEESLTSLSSFGSVQIFNRQTNVELVGPATAVEFELALMFIGYENLAVEPSNPQHPRLIEFVANDGEHVSEPAIATVTILTVNDPPRIALRRNSLDVVLTYIETDQSLSLVPSDARISDVDTSLLAFVNITITNFMQGVDQLQFSTIGSNISSELLSGTLLLTGPALPENFVAVLQTIRYVNLDIESVSAQGPKSVEFVVNDGSLNSMTATAFITFSAINDPPIIDLNGPMSGLDYAAVFVEDEGRVAAVSQNLTITDVDSSLLQFVSVNIQGILDPSFEILSTNLSLPDITATYNASSGTLYLQGPSTVSNFEYVLRSLTYDDVSVEPTPGNRRIVFSAFDGNDSSVPVTTTVTVVRTNDAPELRATSLNPIFIEEGGPVQLIDSSSAQIVDTDSAMLSALEVELRNAPDGNLENIVAPAVPNLAISRQTHGNNSFFVLSFPRPFATLESYSLVLAGLSYNNSAAEPVSGERFADITVFDESLRSNVITIPITVQLINDNVPEFEAQAVSASISEGAANQSFVYQATAMDGDFDSSLVYSLYPISVPFSIEPTTGIVSVLGVLDRETQSSYTVNITAFDGLNTGILVLTITVTDVNDNGPVFDMNPFTATVNENAPSGTPVVRAIATDADQGLNGRLSFSITEGNPLRLFTINSTTGEIFTSGSIDFEMLPLHTLSIKAEDLGSPIRQSNTTFVIITVVDLNDNIPVFSPEQDTINVPENILTPGLLYTVRVTDRDANSQLVYNLLNSSAELFFADPTTGQIILVGELDFETASMHLVLIEASDGQHISLFQLRVTVEDVNDNPPVFSQQEYTASISENSTVGTEVIQSMILRITDADSGSNADVQFVLESGDPLNQFAINQVSSNSAQLIVARNLDREMNSAYILVITAVNSNDANQSDSAIILITVSDINDNPPVFDSSAYRVSVGENIPAGTTVGRVVANDADEGLNSAINYRFPSTSPADTFSITSDGYLFLVSDLDYEMVTVYTLEVEAVDGGVPALSATATVIVSIIDANDNPPIFSQQITFVSISENMPAPAIIAVLQANDSDTGSNGAVRYSIPSNFSSDFSIDSITGELTTSRQFDFESDPSEFVLAVTATDGGMPVLSSVANVFINIRDVNEFTPQFVLNATEIPLSEDTASSTVVLDLDAADNDGGSAGVIEYQFSSSAASIPFSINNATGEITLTFTLDRELIPRYEVTVTASNPLISPMVQTSINLVFTIQDVNDNPPVFTQVNQSVTITTSTIVGDTVYVVSATDADIGSNGEIIYSLVDFVEQFNITIGPGFGRVTLAAPLNSSITRTFSLVIQATDLGQPSLSSRTVLTINVIQPLLVDFKQQGVGFLLGSHSPTTQDFGFFVDSAAGSEGRISATLGGVSVSSTYSTSLLEATTVRGIVLNEEVWPDMPQVTVMAQVADITGDVRCVPSEVVVTLIPDAALATLLNINPQVKYIKS